MTSRPPTGKCPGYPLECECSGMVACYPAPVRICLIADEGKAASYDRHADFCTQSCAGLSVPGMFWGALPTYPSCKTFFDVYVDRQCKERPGSRYELAEFIYGSAGQFLVEAVEPVATCPTSKP